MQWMRLKMKKKQLYIAVEKGFINFVQILLTNENIDVNILCEKSNKKVVKVDDYEYESEELESMKETALHLAVKKSDANDVKLLLTNPKININMLPEEIKSYKYSKDSDVVENEILEKDMKEYNDTHNETALQIASRLKNDDIIDLLKIFLL
ncbi:hypothetical protein M9Y10_045597 [Tritrichomonas musculus]|uniref:Ankyrin repeat protein n=1 Tax=Tritrichomonas musculus TaxID=1915356 RepID=A0ABR2JYL5_9EUKA